MKHPLAQVIDEIEFENKSKYWIEIRFLNFQSNHFMLDIRRQLMCTSEHRLRWINNSQRIERTITKDELIKLIFMRVGQFEAHEFCESFKYNGKHAYFPHDSGRDRDIPYLYGKSNRINQLILQPWRDVIEERTNWDIANRFFDLWLNSTWFVTVPDRIEKKLARLTYYLRLRTRVKWFNFSYRIKKALNAWRQDATES